MNMQEMVQAAIDRPSEHIITVIGDRIVLARLARLGGLEESTPIDPAFIRNLTLNGVYIRATATTGDATWSDPAPPPPVDHKVCVLDGDVIQDALDYLSSDDGDIITPALTAAQHGIELERLARAYVFECAIDAESRFNALEAYLKGMKA